MPVSGCTQNRPLFTLQSLRGWVSGKVARDGVRRRTRGAGWSRMDHTLAAESQMQLCHWPAGQSRASG